MGATEKVVDMVGVSTLEPIKFRRGLPPWDGKTNEEIGMAIEGFQPIIPTETRIDNTVGYHLYLSSAGTVIYNRDGLYNSPYEFTNRDIAEVSPLSIIKENEICPYVMYKGEVHSIDGSTGANAAYLRNVKSDNLTRVSYREAGKIKFLKDKTMLHIKPEEVEATLTKQMLQKERKVKTLINLGATLILSILIIIQNLAFIGVGCGLFLGYIVFTHLCECNYKLNIKIEAGAGLLNFVLFNLATILIGSVLAVINVLHPTVTWKEFFEYTVLVPTLTSIVVAMTAPIYMTIKRGIYLLCVQVSRFVNKLFAI